MTGFGRKRFSINGVLFTAEIRTLNHKHLDIHCKLPENLAALEMPLRNLIKKYIIRGRVDLRVSMEYDGDSGTLELNRPVYKAYCQIISDIAKEYSTNSIDPVALLSLPNVLHSINPDPDTVADSFWPPIELVLAQLSQDRKREGALLWQDVMEKVTSIEE